MARAKPSSLTVMFGREGDDIAMTRKARRLSGRIPRRLSVRNGFIDDRNKGSHDHAMDMQRSTDPDDLTISRADFASLTRSLTEKLGQASEEEINNLFDGIDSDGSGSVSFPEFLRFFEHTSLSIKGVDVVRVTQLHDLPNDISKSWGVMYCGNSAPVIRDLKHFCESASLDLKMDTFDW